MTAKELVEQFCEFRGKCTTDDVVALNFAYEMLAPRWISVEDELPEDDSEVACLTADGEIYIDRYVRGTMYGNIWRKTERKPVKWLPLKAKKGEEDKDHFIDVNKMVDRVVGTPEHIQTALDVLNKKGGEE